MPPGRSIRRFAPLLSVLLLAAAPSAAAQLSTPQTQSATVRLSSSRASARPVALELRLDYEMQCGYPGPGPVAVRLPEAEHVPAAIAPAAVIVDGRAAPAVHLSGHTITVGLAAPPRVMCDVIGPGRLTIELTRAAGLGNPARAGSYTLSATRGAASFAARFAIRAR